MTKHFLLTLVTLAAVVAFGLIVWPFATPIAWALCLGAASRRPFLRLERALGRPRLAALIMVLLVPIVLFLPMVFMVGALLEEVQVFDVGGIVRDIEAGLSTEGTPGGLRTTLDGIAQFLGFADFADVETVVAENRQSVIGRLLGGSLALGVFDVLFAPIAFLFGFIVMLITLYFVYTEFRRLRTVVIELSPFTESETDRILESLRGTTTAALLGGILVAVIQGVLGGLSFFIVGLDAPVLWGLVMAIASLLPFGGTSFVWGPAAAYLFVVGSTGSGIFLVVWGFVIVGTADNILRPWILTRTGAHDVHPMMLFFAILSGIGLFGISGIVFGPLLLALVTTVLRIWRERLQPPGLAPEALALATERPSA